MIYCFNSRDKHSPTAIPFDIKRVHNFCRILSSFNPVRIFTVLVSYQIPTGKTSYGYKHWFFIIRWLIKTNICCPIVYIANIQISDFWTAKSMRESPSLVNGVRLRLLSLRGSWVQIPSPALQINSIKKISLVFYNTVMFCVFQYIFHKAICVHIWYDTYNHIVQYSIAIWIPNICYLNNFKQSN